MGIKSWLRGWIQDSLSAAPNRKFNTSPSCKSDEEPDINILTSSVRFSVARASGGYVVQTYFYDKIADRHSSRLYIINDSDEFSTAIGQIITMEALKS